MKLLLSLVILVFTTLYYVDAASTPDRCITSLQKYFVNGENIGIEIAYIDPNGKVVYMKGNSMTGYLFSPDLANVDSYAGLSSENEDCFDGKKQLFSDKKTVEGFYDSRSFRISKTGVATVNNEGQLRTFPITDCNEQGNIFSGYSSSGRLYTFHLTSGKKYELVAQQCSNGGITSTSTSTTGGSIPTTTTTGTGSTTTGISTTTTTTTGNSDLSKIEYTVSIENSWSQAGVTFAYVTVKVENNGTSGRVVRKLVFITDAKIKEDSIWGVDKISDGSYSIPDGIQLNDHQSYTFNLIIIGNQKPTFTTTSIN